MVMKRSQTYDGFAEKREIDEEEDRDDSFDTDDDCEDYTDQMPTLG